MPSKLSIALSAAVAAALVSAGEERVLGVYIFHRHGDRTAKAWAPVNLTALGAEEVHSSGSFYRKRYVQNDASVRIAGVSSNNPILSQLSATAPEDAVLYNSAVTFLQGLYPPTGQSETLANGTRIEAPLGGYQYIPVNAIGNAATANKAENQGWLQGASDCDNGVKSSNAYFASSDYQGTYDESLDLYQSLLPVINTTYTRDAANFKNAYTIWDYINAAKIHNSSIPSSNLIDNRTFGLLFNLASIHEWNLAYNASEPVRAIAGSVLAGQVLDALQAIVDGAEETAKLNVQFGAYGTFMAFFGLAQLPTVSRDFYGIVDYASSMTFELFTTSTAAKPSANEIKVRFLFANGTAAHSELRTFPLFGQDRTALSWSDFKSGMSNFAVTDTKHWCALCGGTSGTCAANSATGGNGSSAPAKDSPDNGVSKPVAGAIGALVTLVVIFGIQAALMLLGGLRLVKKSTLARAYHGPETAGIKSH
ncbi:Histidine phosphatase superfamily, clade-2 [Metarhizium album ARSEF 1941]|uniref:Histidine phosphatase superfamily, clade-2 n=1 Tax=Metarhizium album (strain ARSEF 1941) TaxID=1081103 RepID=A0A0B2X492_METAS|nr:Histidine phosphatase superfamily, clade-2 [Metarhizium album ARSEF 1941]KHO00126.1 Histidine phosphatase superfamily, clade-2 [Metarhizium album ARSEF 1941]